MKKLDNFWIKIKSNRRLVQDRILQNTKFKLVPMYILLKNQEAVMKKRDFLAGVCCGVFIARASELKLSDISQTIVFALVILAINLLWEWIKNVVTKNSNRNVALRRLPKYS